MRKIQYHKDSGHIWEYFVKDLYCECGCNVFHQEYDGENIYGVCNACQFDKYMIQPQYINDELNRPNSEWK